MQAIQSYTATFIVLAIIAACLFALTPSTALAQVASASGVATGGDKITAIVPEAGDIFTSLDEVGTMDENMRQCAKDGLFYNQETEECRQGIPPRVTFYRSSGDADTFVNVELAHGQERPGNANDNSPAGFSRFGGLDGDDGSYTTP